MDQYIASFSIHWILQVYLTRLSQIIKGKPIKFKFQDSQTRNINNFLGQIKQHLTCLVSLRVQKEEKVEKVEKEENLDKERIRKLHNPGHQRQDFNSLLVVSTDI